MNSTVIFVIYLILHDVSTTNTVEDAQKNNEVKQSNEEILESLVDTQTPLSSDISTGTPKEISEPPKYPPLVIYTDEKMSVGYILNVSNQDRPNSILSGLYHFACPHQPQNSENNNSSISNWLEVKSFIEVIANDRTAKERLLREETQWKCDKPVTPTFEVLSENVTEDQSHKIAAIGFKKSTILDSGFQWFTILLVQFDPNSVDVKNVSYKMNEYLPSIPDPEPNLEELEKYYLGKNEFFGLLDIAQLYSIENQELIFSTMFPDEKKRRQYFDKDAKRLVPLHLAPLNVYTVPHIKEAAKTFSNLAPMWKVIREDDWRKLEDYLQLLTQVIREEFEEKLPSIALEIISGTYDVLKLSWLGPKIFLGSNEKVSVPSAFYKIVALEISSYLYSILIVTTNNPYSNKEMLCYQDECKMYGWQAIQNNDYTKNRTICCQMDKRMVKRLHLNEEYFKENQKVLNLDKLEYLWNGEITEISLLQYMKNHTRRVNYFFESTKEILKNKNTLNADTNEVSQGF